MPKTDDIKAGNRHLSELRSSGGWALKLAIAAPLAGGGLLLWQAWLLAGVLGDAIEMAAPAASLMPAIATILVLLLIRAGLSAIGEQAGTLAAERIKLALRRDLFAQSLARAPRDPDAPQSGVTANAIVDQIEALDGFFARYLPASYQAALLPLIFGAIILPLDWVAGVLFLVTAPLIPVFMALVGWGAQIATDRQAQALTRLSGRFADRLSGLLTLKLLGRAEAETQNIVLASEALRRRTLRVLRIAFLSSAVLEFFAALGVAGIALYVGLTFIDYLHLRSVPLTLHTGMFLLLMAPEIYNPLRLLAAHYHDRAAARAALTEIAAQLGGFEPGTRPVLTDFAPVSSPAIAVDIAAMTLRTPDRMRPVLIDANLRVQAGQHVAILGSSGSGKSSLLEAMIGLRQYAGQLSLDGRALADWDIPELRGRTFLLTQKPRLVHGTIAQNIALARPAASRREIGRAADQARVSGFAAAFAEGLDTLIGENGIGLSGGQAQRVALARLFLRDAGLLLLDEPTAHLNAELEAEVMSAILNYARGRTLVVATHSRAVAAQMDKAWRIAGHDLLSTPAGTRLRGIA
ncbi:MAG: thiol reductant ABC exporter subunit CydD [Devosia sp.]|uniref:thiol reductant ABC exporter subunit CydD n=1 Tax=Devosia sp. TaxID=1871048 RepID=UPI0024C7CD6B|nr:thiol reductant ABC exporter subunit CydD [Devosia sp.]UYN99627.1 MAG: thiol reductant ABC exporter subunit CydD [Devosia sp.]